MGTSESVERIVAPVLSSLGLDLVDVEARPGRVMVTIERDGGLDLAAISQATAAVSDALDAADVVPGGRYELEVSSPGVERRLRRPEHFQRFVGAEVAFKLKPGVEGDRRFEATIAKADTSGVVVVSPSVENGRRISYRDIERAHTVFDWRAALAAAPLAPNTHKARREGRPSAADRSRAAASARSVTEGGSLAGSATRSQTLPAADRKMTENL